MKQMYWIKLETTSEDEYGPIYVYIDTNSIISVSRFKNLTNVYLSNGQHYIVKETPKEIFQNICKLMTGEADE